MENMRFKQLRLNYINSQKTNKKERQRLVTSSFRVDMVPKTNDEVYFSNTIKLLFICFL